MVKRYIYKIIPFFIMPLAVISIQRFSSSPIGGTAIYWVVDSMILLLFWGASKLYFDPVNTKNYRFIKWFLLWNVFCIIRGALFMSDNYWDYKNLTNMGMALLMPIVAYAASNERIVQSIMSFYVKYTLPLLVLFIPFLPLEGWGWYLFPLSFLTLFVPTLKFPWKVLIIVVSLIAAGVDISARSHIFKFCVPILLVFIFYYLRFLVVTAKYMQTARLVLLIAPWVFFLLAASGGFNVFKIDEYIEGIGQKQEEDKQALSQDSRTFLYEEVLSSALKHNYWFLGRTPARGNDTKIFVSKKGPVLTGRKERVSNEANILNIFTWNGIVGVIFYFLVFYKASYLAINRSSNIYIKMLGVFIAFRWAYAWVEDYATFDINNFVIWMMVGCCFSDSFRRMSNAEVKLWARGIFERKYYIAYKKYVLSKVS